MVPAKEGLSIIHMTLKMGQHYVNVVATHPPYVACSTTDGTYAGF
jgi:hypothetical protein